MKIVVLGCGAILEYGHRKPLQDVTKKLGCQVVGLVDPSPNRLAQAQRWFPGAETFASGDACFAKVKDVSLTVITTPPPFHAVQTELAFSHGSHVLCEKPLAGSVEDAERIVTATKKHGKKFGLGMTRRYSACLIEAQKRIREGALGNNLKFLHREGGVYSWPVSSPAPFRRDTGGGGVLLDKGIHVLDSLEFLFGHGEVESAFDDGSDASVEANSIVEIRFQRAKGRVQLSWDTNLSSGMQIVGSEGEFWIPAGSLDTLFSRSQPGQPWQRIMARVEWPLDLQPSGGKMGSPLGYDDCFLFQLVQMLRAITLGEQPSVSAEEGLSTMRLISSAYGMAAPLVKPWLQPHEQMALAARHWRKPAGKA